MRPEDTHGIVCDFGTHMGKLYTRIPVSYLCWMVNVKHSMAHIARAELERRGTTLPELEVSGHALDRASMNCLDVWRKTRQKDEGINAWLLRVSKAALEAGDRDKQGRYRFQGMLFAFERDGEWPVLKTVIRKQSG